MNLKFISSSKAFAFLEPVKTISLTAYKLTIDLKLITPQIENKVFKNYIGEAQFKEFVKNPLFVQNLTGEKLNTFELFSDFQNNCQSILGCLWFVKDNSVSTTLDCAFVGDEQFGTHVSDNFNSSSTGTFEVEYFSVEEIKQALVYHNKLVDKKDLLIIEHDKSIHFTDEGSGIITKQYIKVNDNNRVKRALLFLSQTRSTHICLLKSLFI